MLKKKQEELRKKVARLTELRGKTDLTETEATERRGLVSEIKTLGDEVAELRKEQELMDGLDQSLVAPPNGGDPNRRSGLETQENKPIYRTLGDQMVDIIVVDRDPGSKLAGEARKRLDMAEKRSLDLMPVELREDAQQVKADAYGGGLVQGETAFELVDKGFNNGVILSKCAIRNSASGNNAMTIYGLDEESRADGSRYGGIVVKSKREMDNYDASRARFAEISLRVEKITGLLYLTDEILEDAPMLEGEVSNLFPKAFGFKLQDLILRGEGAGEPLGILKSKALVTIAKESGQAAATIDVKNISKMKARAAGNPEFYGNRDLIPQLDALYRTFESSSVFPLFKQTSANTGVLDGIPITFIEQAETLGTLGDLILADFAEYVVLRKGEISKMDSLHFKFDKGLKAIKWTMRIDGQSRWKSPLTPYKGSATTSPFVALAARA